MAQDSSQGRRARLRDGVFDHVWKPHSDFPRLSHHSEATLASSLPGLDFRHPGFTSFSVSGRRATTPLAPLPAPSPPPPPSSPRAPPPVCQGTPWPVPPPWRPQPSNPCTPHRCQGCQELISIVRWLTFQLEALQTEVHCMARAAASPPPSRAYNKRAVLAISLPLLTLLFRLHLPLLTGFAPVVAASPVPPALLHYASRR